MSARLRGAAARQVRAAALALPLAAGCASGPWDVAPGDELRFKRSVRECRMLTESPEGEPGPVSFDQCMGNRGWRRMGPLKRLWNAF